MTRRASVAAGLAVLAALLLWWSAAFHDFFDSSVYSGAVRYWLGDGRMVYDFLEEGTRYGFTYPPFSGLVMVPMAYLPFPAIVVVASVATVGYGGFLAGPPILGWLAELTSLRAMMAFIVLLAALTAVLANATRTARTER